MTASVSSAPTTSSIDAPQRDRRRILEALSGLLLGMFVSMLATTVVSTSLPVIINDLEGSQASFTWVVTAMLLTTAISTPVWGKLADLFNRKVLIQIALILFVVATAAAGLSQTPEMLIGFRAVQGIGAGGLAALSQVIMADILSPRERGRYMGLFGAVMAVATVGGPLLGGVITDTWGWRYNFYIAIPFAVLAFFILQRTLTVPARPEGKTRIDYLGIVFLSVAASALLLWVTYAGSDFDWWSIPSAIYVGTVVLATIAFVVTELRVREPLIPLSLFRDATFTLAVVASISIGVAMFGVSVYLSQYMQLARGATPTQAGLMTIPMIGGLLLASIVIGALVTRYGRYKAYLVTGGVLLIAGSFLLATIEYDTPFVLVSIYMFLLGAGVGMTMQNLVLVVQNSARPEQMGVASSGVTFFRSLGGTVGVSVMGAALASRATTLFDDRAGELGRAIEALGERGTAVAQELASGVLPQVATMPESVRVIVEDVYAQSIAHAFLYAAPLAVLSLVAIAFLPNRPLTRMTTGERAAAERADLATVSTSTGMQAIAGDEPRTAGAARTAPEGDAQAEGTTRGRSDS